MWMGMLCWRLLVFHAKDDMDMKHFRQFQLGLPIPNGAVYRLTEVATGHWAVTEKAMITRQTLGLAGLT
jgi:hypothetical protein